MIKIQIESKSIIQLRQEYPDLFWIKKDAWYDKEKWATAKPKKQTIWLHTKPVKGSFNKTWEEQQRLLAKDEFVPTVNMVIQAMAQHYKATGQRLFETCWVRASDVTSFGYRVCVGDFDAKGLSVHGRWDGGRFDDLGLAAYSPTELQPSEPLISPELPNFDLEAVVINGTRYVREK